MSQKKKLILIAAAALVLIVAGVITLAISGRKANDSKEQADTTQQKKKEEQDALLGETFTDAKTGVTFRVPIGWQLTAKNSKDPTSLTKFGQSETRANGELLARKYSGSLDDIVRGYLEAALDISINSKLIDNQDVNLGDRTVRLLSHELPGPNSQSARLTQYIFYKDGTYYIVAYTTLLSDWEAQKPAIEASAASLEF